MVLSPEPVGSGNSAQHTSSWEITIRLWRATGCQRRRGRRLRLLRPCRMPGSSRRRPRPAHGAQHICRALRRKLRPGPPSLHGQSFCAFEYLVGDGHGRLHALCLTTSHDGHSSIHAWRFGPFRRFPRLTFRARFVPVHIPRSDRHAGTVRPWKGGWPWRSRQTRSVPCRTEQGGTCEDCAGHGPHHACGAHRVLRSKPCRPAAR